MPAMTRSEHLRWCKTRAHQEYKFNLATTPSNAVANAIASMIADLGKHPETSNMQQMALMMALTVHDERSLYKFIDGFTEL